MKARYFLVGLPVAILGVLTYDSLLIIGASIILYGKISELLEYQRMRSSGPDNDFL